jgi:hypothetical protein
VRTHLGTLLKPTSSGPDDRDTIDLVIPLQVLNETCDWAGMSSRHIEHKSLVEPRRMEMYDSANPSCIESCLKVEYLGITADVAAEIDKRILYPVEVGTDTQETAGPQLRRLDIPGAWPQLEDSV